MDYACPTLGTASQRILLINATASDPVVKYALSRAVTGCTGGAVHLSSLLQANKKHID
jgi:hypothetical protein